MTITDALLSTVHLTGAQGLTACGRQGLVGIHVRVLTDRPILVTCSACIDTLAPTAWPINPASYFTKVKAAGMWTPARYHTSFEDALAAIRDLSDPAVIADGTTSEIVYVNLHAAAFGMMTAYESRTAVCPIHGEGCEAWA